MRDRRTMRSLFRTKPLDTLLGETEHPEQRLKRTLGPVHLTLLGVGAIISAGIFSTIGTAAAGGAGHTGAGPALVLSFVLVAVACGFAALCYSEFAAMVPVSGSAYTYSYATLGELIAWIIGWDLILEYAVGNMAVAVGWSGYFVALCGSAFGLKFPLWLVNDHRTATDVLAKGGDALNTYSSTTLPVIAGHSIAFNLPALLIVVAVTILLIYGIRESAKTNTIIVIIKLAVV